MSKIPYNPSSHFYADQALITDADSAHVATDSYGPVTGDEANKFRTTSVIRTSAESQVFAICDGQLLIQPLTGESDKVNLILKPSASYAPFKIKYFIYRGVDKASLLNGLNIASQTSDSPEFIQRIWAAHISLHEALDQPLPPSLPASFIGYDETNQPGTELMDEVFLGSASLDFNLYDIPKCFKGESIGKFSGEIGLDIVLDYGDYVLEYEEELFRLNMDFARKKEHVFDLSTVVGAVKQKRYKEHIHQFIDPAAFWGSHIESGELFFNGDATPKTALADIYPIVSKYQTKHKLYLYIQGERTRSYNFFGNYEANNIHFEISPSPVNYQPYDDGNGWPILIKEFSQPSSSAIDKLSVVLKNITNSDVENVDRHRVTYVKSSNRVYDTGAHRDRLNQYNATSTTTGLFQLIQNADGPGSTKVAISNMFLLTHLGNEDMPLIPYYKDLFGLVNIKNSLVVPDDVGDDFGVWASYSKTRLINFDAINKFKSAVVNTKVVFDVGVNSASNAKERRLYISENVDLLSKNTKIIRNTPSASFKENFKDNYELELFNDSNFKVYKGQIKDGSTVIDTLSLAHAKNHLLKQGIFQLGILEEEYNKLMYDSVTVPVPLPSTPHIPTDATTIFFHLEEDSANEGYRKFKLGLEYEDSAGNLQVTNPSSANEVEVYTIDGFYFFSKEFSEYQDKFSTLARTSARFRPVTSWHGEIGFDWPRIDDSGILGDTSSAMYHKLLGHYYSSSPRKKAEEGPEMFDSFDKEEIEWQAFQTLFPSYAKPETSYSGLKDFSLYNSSVITLYPSLDTTGVATAFPKLTSNGEPKCITSSFFDLKLQLDVAPTGLKLRFETEHFEIDSIPPAGGSGSPTMFITDAVDPTKYSCLEIIDKMVGTREVQFRIKALKEFPEDKKIQVLATEGGVELLSGELIVTANVKSLRKEVKLLMVNLKTDSITTDGVTENGIDFPNSTIEEEIEDLIIPFFNQSLVDIIQLDKLGPQLSPNPDLSLDVTPTSTMVFNNKYIDPTTGIFNFEHDPITIATDLSGNAISAGRNGIHYDLKSFLFENATYAADYADHLIIFYIGLDNPVPGGQVNGVGLFTTGLTLVMKNGIGAMGTVKSTSAHELMHALGVHHTFDSRNPFTFKQFKTDNIMDYVGTGSPPKRISMSVYQDDIYKKNRHTEYEK